MSRIEPLNAAGVLRRFILVILALGFLGAGAELLLVGHTEELWQWIPLPLIGAAFVLLVWLAAAPRAGLIRLWQVLMLLFIASGGLGLGLHWKGKMEFKQESDPSLAGIQLFWESMKTQSPPALAPGVMIQMGLLGLAFAYRHPALETKEKDSEGHTGENE